MSTPQDILASGGTMEDGIKIQNLVGQVVTITDFVTTASTKYPGRMFVNFGYVDSDGNEGRAYTGGKSVVQKLGLLKEAGALPIEVLVTTYETDKGNPGYDLVNPE